MKQYQVQAILTCKHYPEAVDFEVEQITQISEDDENETEGKED